MNKSINVAERNQKIIDLHASGATLQTCGDAFGITRERVRQILKSKGIVRVSDPVNRTGMRGVYKFKKRLGYGAQIYDSSLKRQIFLGKFDSAEGAGRAYDAAAVERFGADAILNFPKLIPSA